ncbi:hypothetical protein J4434_01270 [Candidatus Woesearchaeota archaeon]|nr:hypothetical protein [Candidatus Woesearchaeota archaeon]
MFDYFVLLVYPTDAKEYNTYPEIGYEDDYKFVEYFLSNPAIFNEVKTLGIEDDPLQDSDGFHFLIITLSEK